MPSTQVVPRYIHRCLGTYRLPTRYISGASSLQQQTPFSHVTNKSTASIGLLARPLHIGHLFPRITSLHGGIPGYVNTEYVCILNCAHSYCLAKSSCSGRRAYSMYILCMILTDVAFSKSHVGTYVHRYPYLLMTAPRTPDGPHVQEPTFNGDTCSVLLKFFLLSSGGALLWCHLLSSCSISARSQVCCRYVPTYIPH